MTQSTAELRHRVVTEAIDDIRKIEAELGVTRQGVEAIRDRLIEMASHREAFPLDDFPMPAADQGNSYMYRLSQDDDGRFALYAQRSRGQVDVPPHNHKVWASVVGFDGQELNKFYDRPDGDNGAVQKGERMVEAGTGVAMLPDDVHTIHLSAPALNFHCYAVAFEHQTEREYWSETDQRWKKFTGTSEIREARLAAASC